MKVIYKYKLETALHQNVRLPAGSKILRVDAQGEYACMWALCDPDKTSVEIDVFGFVTGASLPHTELQHIGTCLFDSGAFVFHYFIRAGQGNA